MNKVWAPEYWISEFTKMLTTRLEDKGCVSNTEFIAAYTKVELSETWYETKCIGASFILRDGVDYSEAGVRFGKLLIPAVESFIAKLPEGPLITWRAYLSGTHYNKVLSSSSGPALTCRMSYDIATAGTLIEYASMVGYPIGRPTNALTPVFETWIDA